MHAIAILNFESLPKTLNEDILDRAFNSCFVESLDMEG